MIAAVSAAAARRERPGADAETFLRSPRSLILHYLRSRPWTFASLALLAFGAASCSVGVQYGMKLLVDAMSAAPAAVPSVDQALLLFVVLIALESCLWRLSGWVGAHATVATGVDIRLDLLSHLTGHPMSYFQENFAGALGHRVTSTAGAFGALVNKSVWEVGPPLVNFLGALIVFSSINPLMAAALALFILVSTGGLIAIGLLGRPYHRAYADQASKVTGELIDVIANIWAVKAFSARARERERLLRSFSAEAAAQTRSWRFNEKARIAHDVMLLLMAGSMLIWAVRMWEGGAVTPGDVVIVSALTFRILHGSRDLAVSLVDMSHHLTHLGEWMRILGVPHAVRDCLDASDHTPQRGLIEFRSVSFGYRADRSVLRGLSLTVPAGQKLGIVGASGAGKTTMIHLVQRLFEPQSGEILIDEMPVHRLKQDRLRSAVAAVPQDVTLFHRSIMENIRFAKPEASNEDVYAAAQAAFIDRFIRDLPEGYETLVGERGMKLSGGQRQRIGIARAFLKDAPIVVLDEATSALDTTSELEVQAALFRLLQNRTVLAVAHRLSTVARFDRVVVIAEGHIVEDGAPDDLRSASGPFARMWSLQAEGLAPDASRVPPPVGSHGPTASAAAH